MGFNLRINYVSKCVRYTRGKNYPYVVFSYLVILKFDVV